MLLGLRYSRGRGVTLHHRVVRAGAVAGVNAIILLIAKRTTIRASIAITPSASTIVTRTMIVVAILRLRCYMRMNPLLAHITALLTVLLAAVITIAALAVSAIGLMMVMVIAITVAVLQRASRPQLMMNITTNHINFSYSRIITSIKCVTKNSSAVLSQRLAKIIGIVKVNYDISLVLWVRILYFGMLQLTTASKHSLQHLQSRKTLQYSCV